jgi:hypothetical protein
VVASGFIGRPRARLLQSREEVAMKRLLFVLLLLGAPQLARAGGLLDFTPAEKKGRDLQKSVKKSVDHTVDKHTVTVGGEEPKKPEKKSAKKSKKPQ